MTTVLLASLLLIATATGEDEAPEAAPQARASEAGDAFPPLPERAEPKDGDLDALGFSDKIPFYQGRPVVISSAGETPVITSLEVNANGILVAPSYLSYLEKRAAWGVGAEQNLKLTVAEHEDRQARLEWMLARTQADLDAEREPAPVFQRDWVKIAAGALVGSGAVLTAAWALGQVNNEGPQ